MNVFFFRAIASVLLAFAAPLGAMAHDRAQTLMAFEGVPARYQAMYSPGAFVRQLKASAALDGRVTDPAAFAALDVAANASFMVAQSLDAIGSAVAGAAPGGRVSDEASAAVVRFAALREALAARDDSHRAAFIAGKLAQPVDAERSDLLARMAVADLREIDFSNQLLLTAVLRNLTLDGPSQLGGMSDPALDQGVEMLWSRGVTSGRSRNLLIVARELDLLATRALLADLSNEDVAALLAWRSDPQAEAERDALRTAYREEVKAGGARTVRALVRRWPR